MVNRFIFANTAAFARVSDDGMRRNIPCAHETYCVARSLTHLRLVIGEGLLLIGAGLIVGIGATLAVTRLMAGLLYGVSATDPITLVAIPIILAGVALAACFVPATPTASLPWPNMTSLKMAVTAMVR